MKIVNLQKILAKFFNLNPKPQSPKQTAPSPLPVNLCGDGLVVAGETCDDRNRIGGDGCNTNCSVERGYRYRTYQFRADSLSARVPGVASKAL